MRRQRQRFAVMQSRTWLGKHRQAQSRQSISKTVKSHGGRGLWRYSHGTYATSRDSPISSGRFSSAQARR
ncbi:hypothetical protein D9M69_364630 [compost metagenome]